MIIGIRSDHPSFKNVEFKKGFNVILANRTKSSTDKDSRNGLGKSTLLEIIHFCLGAKSESLKIKELENWTFILDIILKGKKYTVCRNTKNFQKVKIEGDFSEWPIKPVYDKTKKAYFMKINDWTNILGYLVFNLPIELNEQKYTPTFRSLISYFVRRGVGSFQTPFKHYPQQKEWDIQVNNAYLLGLNWEFGAKFQSIKDKTNTLNELKKASDQGLLKGYVGSLGELEADRVRLEMEIQRLEKQLITFKVHPQYYDIQKQADSLTNEIHDIVNKNTLNKQILSKYEESFIEENDISLEKVERIYKEAGFVFEVNLKRSLQDVLSFHKEVVTNRREYLHSEIGRLKDEIGAQERQIELLSDKRSELLSILKTHGALEEYVKLQDRMNTLKQDLENIKNKIENTKKFDEGKSSLKIEKEQLLQIARRDFDERKSFVEEAIQIFNEYSEYLYSEPGILSIDTRDTGFKFDIDIKRTRSQGIGYMKVFCYDLMLVRLNSERLNIKFLIHDSTIFDGVDERQIAKAMELAASESVKHGFQYICAINSDCIPYNDFSDSFRSQFGSYVRLELTDENEEGGLLGFRY
ncbi:DUF2326 domain-containing protein [Methanosarcina sp. DH1]|uniref:DUF2326 domain-containing protein n=1 Tax=Methanosarcina sp. DH1 TaxID=2605695 RepID=UPI001E3CF0E3|nr:DUF2326 domain-containing protein [Methanosarcina sp. DH1]MCC4768162.1 DUF2326 domain-containing protein [Methanosarcina sp. DH1]